MFGYPINAPSVRYWGGRAIFKNYEIDIPGDRQTFHNWFENTAPNIDDPQATSQFYLWLSERAMPWLRKELKRLRLDPSATQEIALHEFKYELRANPNGSYGYLYVGAIEHKQVECEPNFNTVTNKPEKVVEINGQKFVVDDGIVPVGTEGVIRVNSIGPGRVVGYYNERYPDPYKLACLLVYPHNPPDWWLKQALRNDAEKLVKSGDLPKDKNCTTNQPAERSKAYRDFKRDWKYGPLVMWPNDFVQTPT